MNKIEDMDTLDKDDKRFIDDINRNDRYSIDLQRKGVSKQFYTSNRIIQCSNCGKSFNLFFSRAKYCSSCPEVSKNCQFARCVNCQEEIPLNNFFSKYDSMQTSKYIGNIIQRYQKVFGKNKKE